jgi:sec-independent protein translocase protein TatA
MNFVTFAGVIGGWELILILAVVLILFGAKKLPELAKGLGQGIKEFKKATTDVQQEIHQAMEAEPPVPSKKITPPAEQAQAQAVPQSAASPKA